MLSRPSSAHDAAARAMFLRLIASSVVPNQIDTARWRISLESPSAMDACLRFARSARRNNVKPRRKHDRGPALGNGREADCIQVGVATSGRGISHRDSREQEARGLPRELREAGSSWRLRVRQPDVISPRPASR